MVINQLKRKNYYPKLNKSYILMVVLFLNFMACKNNHNEINENIEENQTIEVPVIPALPHDVINSVKEYVLHNGYNPKIAFFINFKIQSGKKRFFIYDFEQNSIIEKGLVSHGSGSVIPNSDSLIFSNIEDSHQSSLGKYKIGNSYFGRYGKSYKLFGLDSTNNNAFDRVIVLHKFECIPEEESEDKICLSLGCPAFSPSFFSVLENYIDSSPRPILLYAFY